MSLKFFLFNGPCLLFFLLVLNSCSTKIVPAKLYTTKSGTMEVIVTGFSNDKGTAAVSLFIDSRGFPDKYGKASKRVAVPIVEGRAVAVFEDIPYGYYAVSVLHDLNRNAVMDRNLLGWPLEAHGLSRGAKGFFGPPDFEDARFGFFAEHAWVRVAVEPAESIRELRRKKHLLKKNRP